MSPLDSGTGSWDLDEIASRLREHAPELVQHLRGEAPNKALSDRRTVRFGTKGGLAVDIDGPNKGRITDFNDGRDKAQSPLQFIQSEIGGDFPGAVRWAKAWLGIECERPQPKARREDRERSNAEREREEAQRRSKVAQIVAEAIDPHGTPAEVYLRGRGIIGPLPPAVRWRPRAWGKYGALVLLATDAGGAIKAVQQVYLTADGIKAPLDVQKRSSGFLAGVAVRLPGTAPLTLAEGPETGLSVWQATGRETWVALGSIGKLVEQVPAGSEVVVARDADPEGSSADKGLLAAIDALVARRCRVRLACPPRYPVWRKPDQKKIDFNDLLQNEGEEAIRAAIASAEIFGQPEVEPTYAAPMGSVEAARAATSEFINNWVGTHEGYWEKCSQDEHPDPPVHLLGAGVGVGKTRAALEKAVGLVGEAIRMGTCGVIAVPRHALGDEQAANFEHLGAEKGLNAHVFRGLAAEDPENPGEKMCRRSVEAQKLGSSGGRADSLCSRGRGKNVERCPFFDVCGTQRQRQTKADLHIVPHALMFLEKPSFIPQPSWVIVDEDITQASLAGFDKFHPDRLSIDEATRSRRIPAHDGGEDYDASDEYETSCNRMRTLLDHLENGSKITRPALLDAGVSVDLARRAHKLVYRCKVDPGVTPSMAEKQTIPRIEKAARVNIPIMKLARLWRLIADTLDAGGDAVPGVQIETVPATDKTESYRSIRLRWRRDIHESWKAPTLLMDATANATLVKPLFPSVTETLDAQAAWPHSYVRQVTNWSASAALLIPQRENDDWDTERGATAKLNNIERVRRLIEVRAFEFRGRGALVDGKSLDVLVICQLGLEEQLRAGRGLPTGVEIAHFNAVAGSDRWKGVACLLIIGRTLPAVNDVETMAEVLGGRTVDYVDGGRYPLRQGGIRMRGTNEGFPLEAAHHPDPLAEALRWQICEGQLIQAIGRARAVNRTADSPVHIEIVTNIPLPIEVDETVTWKEMQPHPREVLAARGFVIEEGRDQAAFAVGVCPDLWTTPKAFERWKARESSIPQTSMINVPSDKRGIEQWPLYRAKRASGRYAQMLRIDPALHPDPRAALEAVVGPLACFEVETPIAEPGSETPSPPSPTIRPALRVIMSKCPVAQDLEHARTIVGTANRLAELSVRLERFRPPIHDLREQAHQRRAAP